MMLGNLTESQIEKRLGIEFPEEIKEFMRKTHQSRAENVEIGKWHCFDIPFVMVCGDMDTATKIFKSLEPLSDQCQDTLRFSLSKGE